MESCLLLCTDLDRTLIPNGQAEESPGVRDLFRKLVAHPGITLAYVSGRDIGLVDEAIATYALPMPDFVLGDVGSTMYARHDRHWLRCEAWAAHIAQDWQGYSGFQLAELLADLPAVRLQEPVRQHDCKLSYYLSPDSQPPHLLDKISQRLTSQGIKANLVWSMDEMAGCGLLDIVPGRAGKRHAIEFLMKRQGFALENTVFAGDSGNDLPVLVSLIPAVLVNNANPELKQEVLQLARWEGNTHALYLARGNFMGLNGNYAAGILEGIVHYHPEFMEQLIT